PAVKEATTRIAGAFAKLRIPDPEVAIQINLTPASVVKEGSWLDLPMAVIMLQAAGVLSDLPESLEGDFVLMGEVGLHGELRRVPGALSIAYLAKPGQSLIVPAGNEKECALILAKPGHDGCRVFAVSTLEEVFEFFSGKRQLENALRQEIRFDSVIPKAVDFGLVRGQDQAKEAAIIAAAGGHNLLLIGPPGEGKSLLASAIVGILPRLANEEKVELTRIYSAYGALHQDGQAVTRRPFRAVHHTVSKEALVGGGAKIPRPGEITLSHHGILFLDEIAEFSRSTLEALRQPMESGEISISRVGATLTYPCRFTLVAAMNPCPCGYYGSDRCTCDESVINKYQKKLSGPLLDRIDLQVELERLSTDERFGETDCNQSPRIRANVEAARERQHKRFDGKDIPHNAAMPGGQVRDYCKFSPSALETYKQLIDTNTLSTRSMDRLAKVSRTVADLAGKDEIEPQHVRKAASFVIGGILRASV
ncbi:MAG: YifB family Mg chelatase-like AAA ATPase, partial [Planctomycetes bacterium]|nr:YifB family Mg chelatase-like AAA ATPase [Planctomycetota bacterium]